jgi:hypothetical protein
VSDLLKQYRKMAANGSFRGLSVMQHSAQIAEVIKAHEATTLLDYGSGAGDAYHDPHNVHHTWGIKRVRIRLYDPSFKAFSHLPPPGTRYDGVICSDVLEHIPEDQVSAFVQALFSYARKFVWASVCCRPAKKLFPDGTNPHVTVKPLQWWRDTFAEFAGETPFYLVETP